ncbi:MAG: class I SAM-dependent methyltransferase [Candidatus Saccharimonadales bacterium]
MDKSTATAPRRADQYNDPEHNYLKYWQGRDYENQAEIMAIKRLLDGQKFCHAADIGGGYGRLCILLLNYARRVSLVEPSQQQLDIAREFLEGYKEIDRLLMQADDLKFKDGSIDLVTMIRVMHHLPDPAPEFAEIQRVLSDDGVAIIEVANYMHGVNRLKHKLKGQPMPKQPVDIRSRINRREDEIPFVNHNPYTVIKQLEKADLHVERILSVSNLRSQGLKKVMPKNMMLAVEGILQPKLAKSFFGPSIFFLVKQAQKSTS